LHGNVTLLALDDDGNCRHSGGQGTVSMIFQGEAGVARIRSTPGPADRGNRGCVTEGKSRMRPRARTGKGWKCGGIPSPKRRSIAIEPRCPAACGSARWTRRWRWACNPKILLADEPNTALDATVQTQILLLLREIAARSSALSVISSPTNSGRDRIFET